MIIRDKFLPDAQNEITRSFLASDYDYLLLLDDDQWGHTEDMLECLINANAFVATIKTYQREYPYFCAIFKNAGNKLVMPVENGEGYVKCDLTGFPMTLISRETFFYLKEPYFRPYEINGRSWNSDVDFFERLNGVFIKPVGCFQHTLNHGDVTQENVKQLRHDGRFTGNNHAQWKLLKSLEEGTFKIEDLSLKETICMERQ
jgi:hypothetical protein